ncbi:MAG: amidohydrolase family protein [Firmicutes bacterium]|nr:amidohydrolase family protein [Bacillota bacterium]MBQ4372326.1 amidohydrolase family protein [Bacillota bacterium]
MINGLKVYDSHAHFGVIPLEKVQLSEAEQESRRLIKEMSVYQSEQWRKAWGFPKPIPTPATIEESVALWKKDMDEKGVDKICFVTAGGFKDSNDNMAKIVQLGEGRFIGYAHHDPFDPKAAEILEDAILNKGLRGIKILGPAIDRPLSDKALWPLWEVCEKYNVPVLFHFGIMGAAGGIAHHINISPAVIHNVAKAFPRVKFIVPHFGCGQLEDTFMLCWACPNVYIDTSGSNQWTRWMPYKITVKDLFSRYYETIGPERIIFGTDGSWFPRGFVMKYFDMQVRDCFELGFSDEDVKNIFSGNIERIWNDFRK